MRAISTQSKIEAVESKKKNGEPRKRDENSFEAFMRKHLHDLGGDRKFVTQVYHAAQEHGIQQVADEKLRFLNISPANRININDPTHDALSKERLRVNAAWTEAAFQKMLVQRSLLPGNAFMDWEHFRTQCDVKVKRKLLMDCMRVFFENPQQAKQDHIWNLAR